MLLAPHATSTSSPLPRVNGRQTLLFDADDTLWENNIYFERAILGFLDLVNHPPLSHAEVRDAFNLLEHERVKLHGYGSSSFRDSMLASLRGFRGRECSQAEREHVHGLTAAIVAAEIELLPGVADSVSALSRRHTLVLMTKGDPQEQTDKLRRSGLEHLFTAVEVVREKDCGAYLALCAKHGFEANTTWMIGNSPKSDVNPALAAGLHAVYVPHANTWVLEHEPVVPAPAGQHLLVLDRFDRLLQVF